MPSLLEKLSFYDPETGRTFIVASDGFYWKEGKKASPSAIAVNNAGNGHESIEDDLPESRFGSKLLQARTVNETLRDDSGARTGLRNRPDYDEWDSYCNTMNRENAKGACLVLQGNVKTASGTTKKAEMYVTAVEFEPGRAFKLANFTFSPDASLAKYFMPRTAETLQKQIRQAGMVAQIRLAKESTLNGFSVMSLDDFVKGASHTAAEDDEPADETKRDEPGKIKRDEPATEQEFGLGSQHRELPDEEMREYMKRIENKEKSKTDKYNYPILHSSNIHIVNDGGKEYDLDKLRQQIMQRPDRLLRKNEKMKHSKGKATQFYNVGLPALKGLVVNEKTGKFVVVDTCPGAGACKTFCYAMRGNYVRLPQTSMFQAKTLNLLVNHPDKFAAKLKAEINMAVADADEDTQVVVRWHDAGDFFSPQYLKMAFDVARAFPQVQFYAYTKVADVANTKKPDNFIINFSEGALPAQTKKVDLTQIKTTITVPQKMFWDLIVTKGAHVVKNKEGQVQFKSPKAWEEFKDRLVETYKVPDRDSILSYNEYIEKKNNDELGDEHKWRVVVPPGAGDDAANDPNVQVSFLMWH